MKQLDHDDIMEWYEDKMIEIRDNKGIGEINKMVLLEEIGFAMSLIRNLKCLNI